MDNCAETICLTAESGERRDRDRRANDRRGMRRAFDPLFAATLVNQIAPAEAAAPGRYAAARGPRAGIAFDLNA